MKMKCQRNLSLVRSRCRNIAARTASTAIATQRPGWRTGTALIGSGRTRTLWVCALMAPAQDTDGLTAGEVIAPASTPHLARIFLYVPSVISACTADATAVAKSVWSLGRTYPYGAEA